MFAWTCDKYAAPVWHGSSTQGRDGCRELGCPNPRRHRPVRPEPLSGTSSGGFAPPVAAMTYQLTDITELIHYHLVLSASDDETADNNLRRLVGPD